MLKATLFKFALCISGICAAHFAAAERSSYSYLGLDIAYYGYQESLPSVNVETDYSATNIGIQTGGYIAVSPDFGFYLTSSNILDSSTETEEWELSGTLVQTNNTQISSSTNLFQLAYQTRDTQAILAGIGVFKFDFDRFNFRVTPEGQNLGIINPNGSVGREDNDVADSISESQLSISAMAGYEFGNLFLKNAADSKNKFRYQAQFLIGLPMYISANNSAIASGYSLTDSFGGIDTIVRLTSGWQLNKNVLIALTVESIYHSRDDIEDNEATLPEIDIFAVKPALSMFWSF
jgi:hypothetical protein